MTRKISSQYYAIFFLFYAIILCFLNNLIFGEFIPSGTKGLWILASFAPLLITELLVRTIASAPYDSAANSVVALATLLSLSGNEQITTHTDNILRVLSFVLLVLFALSLSVIWLERIRRRESLKNSISVFTSQLGNAKAIFTVIHFFVLYALQIGADEVFYLAAIWVVNVFGRPLEWIVDSSRRIYE
ncbi:MAG: hypothetical protein J4G17_07820, partial [Anaerolineae bacterium]|nr:hypothetical protein [Anaerolineae bacterium]